MFKQVIACLTVPAVLFIAACDDGTGSAPDMASGAPIMIDGKSAQEIIEARQAEFKELGKAFKSFSDQVRSGSPDVAIVQAAAAKVPEATQGIENWFPAGTGPESGIETEALPTIWEKPDEFAEKVTNFKLAAAALAEAGKTGDMAAMTAAFQKTGGTCKACHDNFRLDD